LKAPSFILKRGEQQMQQLMLNLQQQYGPWIVTHKGDQTCRVLADRHYTRQTVGHAQFCRPGRNLVLRTAAGDAVWVVWFGIRDDGFQAFEITIFRNESSHLSSELIKWALYATYKEWGKPPKDGIITYVNPKKVGSRNAGFCFLKGGFKKLGRSKKGLLILQAQYKFINQWNLLELVQLNKIRALKEQAKTLLDNNQTFEAYKVSREIMRRERSIRRIHQYLKKHGYQSKTDYVPSVTDEQLEAAGIPL